MFGQSSLPAINPFFGPRPVPGDKVYIDFGDSFLTGGEMTGYVYAMESDHMLVAGIRYGMEKVYFDEAVHIEVLENENV